MFINFGIIFILSVLEGLIGKQTNSAPAITGDNSSVNETSNEYGVENKNLVFSSTPINGYNFESIHFILSSVKKTFLGTPVLPDVDNIYAWC